MVENQYPLTLILASIEYGIEKETLRVSRFC